MSQKQQIIITLTKRQQCDLELIANGGFAPLKTFLGQADYLCVLESARLVCGKLWPIPVVLDVAADIYDLVAVGEKVLLVDEYNVPLAKMTVTERFQIDKLIEAEQIYGTQSTLHFGVKYLFDRTHEGCITGSLDIISLPKHYDFLELRKSPTEIKNYLEAQQITKVVAFQTRNPIHAAHLAMIESAARSAGAHILLHPTTGETKEGDIGYVTRVKSYQKLFKKRLRGKAILALLPLAMRMAGPKEAVWHAIIRKNYGATHFIVGRDHAGPGNDENDKPFYGALAAQQLALKYQDEIGITIIPFSEMVFVKELGKFVEQSAVLKEHTPLNLSGTKFRQLLLNNKPIPKWFSFPEVIKELKYGLNRETKTGMVIFFTGLPSAGKSTLSRILHQKLLEMTHRTITVLDGDVVRKNLSKGLGFSREDRNENIRRIGYVAAEIGKHGGIAICAAIAPFEESRRLNRELISQYATYIEVYVSTPLAECERRDIKGLYKAHRLNKVNNLTGKDDAYEVPIKPEITINTVGFNPEQCVQIIIDKLLAMKLICAV